MAFAIDAGVGVYGFDDGVGSHDRDTVNSIDHVAEGEAQVAVASGEEIQSMCVAIDGAFGDIVVVGDVSWAMPVDEFLLEGCAKLVLTDAAARFVDEIGRRGGFRGAAKFAARAALGLRPRSGFAPRWFGAMHGLFELVVYPGKSFYGVPLFGSGVGRHDVDDVVIRFGLEESFFVDLIVRVFGGVFGGVLVGAHF